MKQLDEASATLGQQLPAFPEVARSLKTQASCVEHTTLGAVADICCCCLFPVVAWVLVVVILLLALLLGLPFVFLILLLLVMRLVLLRSLGSLVSSVLFFRSFFLVVGYVRW